MLTISNPLPVCPNVVEFALVRTHFSISGARLS